MQKIDCFFVGHNEMPIDKNRRMLQYLYGNNSHEYRDRRKYNLSQLITGNKRYTPVEFFNHVRQDEAELSIITESFNLAIACLGNYLHQHGLTFDFINSFQDDKEILKEKLVNNEILAVGIITTYYLSHHPIHEIISFIRKYNREVKIIIGGPYVINKARSMPEEKLLELFKTIKGDFFVKDPSGEDILANLIQCIKSGSSPAGVRNVYYRDGDAYKFSFEKAEHYSFASNQIDWNLFDGRLAPVINLRTAVSCPYKCSFCNFPSYAGKYSLSPLEYAEKELKLLHAQGVRYIQFVDDTFNVPQGRFQDLLRMMIRNEFGFKWNSYFKCAYADEETVRLMKESGCQFVFLGIESGSQVILDNMNKKNNVDVYRKCIALFNKYDIMTMCSIIVGFPGETEETFRETFSFIEETKPTFYQQRLWWYDHTAPVHNDRQKFNISGEGYYWEHATMNAATAHQLADEMFLNIRNCIHITEYSLPFFLLGRGLSRESLQEYLRNYMYINREQYLKPETESSNHFVNTLIRAACAKAPAAEAAKASTEMASPANASTERASPAEALAKAGPMTY
jgi:anaerobic magnesium-protoporphyrin IX monomethyl ester cyclase